MSNRFGLGGRFLDALAANGVSDNDLERVMGRGLSADAADAIKQIIAHDRELEKRENAERMRIHNAAIDRLEELSGVSYDASTPYQGMIQVLRDKGILRLGQLKAVDTAQLFGFGLNAEQSIYIDVALREINLRETDTDEE